MAVLSLTLSALYPIGLIAGIIIALEAIAFYFLTQEVFTREQGLLYGDLIFTIAWAAVASTSLLPTADPFGSIFVIVWLVFLGLTIVFALAPLLMYVSKLREFTKVGKGHAALAADYDQIGAAYKEDSAKLEYLQDRVRKMSDDLGRANDLYATAKRTPEVIIM